MSRVEDIAPALQSLRKVYRSGKTRSYEWRRAQLASIFEGIEKMTPALKEALNKDLGRDAATAYVGEIAGTIGCCFHTLETFKDWMKDDPIETPAPLMPARSRLVKEPLGVCLIMGSWNFPLVTTLEPLFDAIAAGNCCIIKPSEISEHTAKVMKEIIEKYLDKECFKVLEGGAEIATALTAQKFDLICFTGSTMKGKLVAQAAARNLVPVILELGGKCPVVIDESANVDYAARKIAMARFFNSGQTCIATDYVLVHAKVKEQFLDRMQAAIRNGYGEDASQDGFYARCINEFHTNRLLEMVKNAGGKVLMGGKGDVGKRFVEPTIVVDPPLESKIMQEEIFGPILPVITFDSMDKCIELIQGVDKPLAVYYFGSIFGNKNRERLEAETQSGAFTVNDVLAQKLNRNLPFGGVGGSGQGRLGGQAGFNAFSNLKSVLIKPIVDVKPFNLFMPPFTEEKKGQLVWLVDQRTNLTQEKMLRGFALIIVVLFVLRGLYSGLFTLPGIHLF